MPLTHPMSSLFNIGSGASIQPDIQNEQSIVSALASQDVKLKTAAMNALIRVLISRSLMYLGNLCWTRSCPFLSSCSEECGCERPCVQTTRLYVSCYLCSTVPTRRSSFHQSYSERCSTSQFHSFLEIKGCHH